MNQDAELFGIGDEKEQAKEYEGFEQPPWLPCSFLHHKHGQVTATMQTANKTLSHAAKMEIETLRK